MKDGPGIAGGGQWNRSQLPSTTNRLFPSMQSTVGLGIESRSAHWERKISNRDRIKVLKRSCSGLKKNAMRGPKECHDHLREWRKAAYQFRSPSRVSESLVDRLNHASLNGNAGRGALMPILLGFVFIPFYQPFPIDVFFFFFVVQGYRCIMY
jgi:hypothetical protein